LLSEKVSEDIISGDDVNKQECKRGDSELAKKCQKNLNSIILSKLLKPTNLLQISYFTKKKLVFNEGGRTDTLEPGINCRRTSQCNAGLWGNTGENELGISFLLRNRLGHITPHSDIRVTPF
jgi:hypothetical protein